MWIIQDTLNFRIIPNSKQTGTVLSTGSDNITMSLNVRPDEDVKFTPPPEMSTNRITNVHNTIEMNIAEFNSAEPKESDVVVVVEVEIVSRNRVVTPQKGEYVLF